MTKRNYIAFGLIILIVFLGLGLYLVLTTNRAAPLGNTLRNILPFGKGDNVNIPINGGYVGTTTPSENGVIPRLVELSSEPVAGYTSLIKNGFEVVRYVDRATGHITDIRPDTLEKVQITNKTTPKIYEAIFKSDGSKVIYRTLPSDGDVVANTSITLVPPKATSTADLYTTTEVALRSDMTDVAPGTGESLFFVTEEGKGVFSTDFQGSKLSPLFSSAFTGWRIAPMGPNLLLYTRPDSTVTGFAYILNLSNKTFSKLFGPLYSLEVLPNASGSRLLFSFTQDDTIYLTAEVVKTGDNTVINPSTIVDKCVWSKKNDSVFYCGASDELRGSEPESWYRGITHYSDKIWRFDADSSFSDAMIDPKKDFGVDIDVVNPQVSFDEDYLLFMNKNDLSLWAFKLE